MAEPTYLTAKDVAELLQVDVKSVYRYASTDATMPATRIVGVVRFEREALMRWLDQHTQGRRKGRAA
jgi:excisionase family DNA binding protein